MAGNKTIVMGYKNGQLIVTIPRALANASNITKGTSLEWLYSHGDLLIRKV